MLALTRISAAAILLLCAGRVPAAELMIGLSAAPSSLDPHFRDGASDRTLSRHLFDRLLHTDERGRLRPGLAVAVKRLDATTWELELRPGVRFHDGRMLTSADVVASLERVARLADDPVGLGRYARGKRAEAVDDLVVRIHTEAPEPLLLSHLAAIGIVSALHAGAPRDEFDRGAAAVGTGPYRLRSGSPGDELVLERNELYWGTKPEWTSVVLRAIPSASARVEALLKGDVQFIEKVPTLAVAPFESSAQVSLSRVVSNRLIYLQMDQHRDRSPYAQATAADGSTVNPLKDVRVRRAIAKAIDRAELIAAVMDGVAVEASQLLPDGAFGTSLGHTPIAHDPQGARALLAQADWAGGLELTLHGPAGRYTNDAQIIDRLAGMLQQVGIRTRPQRVPAERYFTRATRGFAGGTPEFSFMLLGWDAASGEASSPLGSIVHSYDRARRLGMANRGHYANAEVDELIERALVTLDDAQRANLLAHATEIALGEVAIIPLHFQVNAWGLKAGLAHRARADGATLAMDVYSD